jgi:FMN-dependent NADH-azoreductase
MSEARDLDRARRSGGTLLHVSASPRGVQSESLAIAAAFLGSYRATHPDVRVQEWDLWDGALPDFGPAAAAAKMAVFGGADPEGAAALAWRQARDAFDRVAAADEYLFSVPMWNHGVPYILKQLIDVISQPGMVFGFDPEQGYTGLLQGKRATVIYTSAVYGADRPLSFGTDFQAPYFDNWLEWAGISDHRSIFFRPNLATANPEPARAAALLRARDLGAAPYSVEAARAS